mgnify:CR=1 FL=1
MDANRAIGLGLLVVGMGLLIFTFYCAYNEYTNVREVVVEAQDPWAAFSQVLGPLIQTCIKVMFLGVMGWAGVILVSRAVQLLREAPREEHAPEILPSFSEYSFPEVERRR